MHENIRFGTLEFCFKFTAALGAEDKLANFFANALDYGINFVFVVGEYATYCVPHYGLYTYRQCFGNTKG